MKKHLIPCPSCTDGFKRIVMLDGEGAWEICPTCDGECWVDAQDYRDDEAWDRGFHGLFVWVVLFIPSALLFVR